MADEMSNLMKMFERYEEEKPQTAPEPPNGAPEPASNGGESSLGLDFSQAEAAAARLQQMILDESQAPAQQQQQSVPVPPPPPQEPPPAPVQLQQQPVESLTHEEYQAIHEALRSIADRIEALPRAGENTEQLLTRIGPGGMNFVRQAMEVAEKQPGILPRSFDLEGFRQEARMLYDLGSLGAELRQLNERVSASEARLGSEAFTRALGVYQAAKMADAAGEWRGLQG